MKSVLLLSGGVDSTALAYYLANNQSQRVHAVTFRYGQRNADREIAAAARTARRLFLRHTVIELHPNVFAETALTGFGEIPWAPTSDVDATSPVVVPGRNTVFLVSAASVGLYDGATSVYFATTAEDSAAFPDCRIGYLAALNSLLKVAGMGSQVIAPFISRSKAEVVGIGAEAGADWADAYSCYVGKAAHCGKCGACLGRLAAFAEAGVDDVAEHKYPAAR
jgi:7-cyano-7-deazaguanine synthase